MTTAACVLIRKRDRGGLPKSAYMTQGPRRILTPSRITFKEYYLVPSHQLAFLQTPHLET
ncbi:hypothetical protein M514_26950 [Trichuris suis]|uniref:Uncharacterized protein n=1 Tax=Trichuris suis TaxID=68888 RepID=A0A085MUJ3_9BILA|nr:hypothetical protein M514_26950 [Trichuris suis]